VSRNFGSRGLENKAGLKASWAETPKLEVPKCQEDGSSENRSLGTETQGPESPEIMEIEVSDTRKTQSQTELRKLCEVEMSFVLVRISYKCCGLFMKFNGLTNFEFNCTVRVQSSTKAKTPVNQRQVWSGEECKLPLKWKTNGKERMLT
jgi:hypothetical protein